MIGIIVLGHGKFASGMEYAIKQIIGKQEGTAFIDFYDGKSPESLRDEILSALQHINHSKGILFCCDILGGTPFRVASTLSAEITLSLIHI